MINKLFQLKKFSNVLNTSGLVKTFIIGVLGLSI